MRNRKSFEQWLNECEYRYREENPLYEPDQDKYAKRLAEIPKGLNPFWEDDARLIRERARLMKLQEENLDEPQYIEGGYKLKDKYAITSEKRYENFYICGEDLRDAFRAHDEYIEHLESEIKRLEKEPWEHNEKS